MNDTLKTIFERKSVRHFAKGTVAKEDIELILRAGFSAPTARNSRPWVFIVADDRAVMDQLADELPYAKMLYEAGIAVIVCSDLRNEAGRIHRIDDCSCAAQNILLAAESLGYGAIWTAAYPDPQRIDAVARACNLPEYIEPLCVIPIGIPTGEDKPKDKFDPEKIKYNKWQ